VTAAAFLLAVLSSSVQPAPCREAELTALLRAREQIARGDESAAQAALAVEGERCVLSRVAMLALQGWREARALAPLGGPVDAQGAVRKTLDELRALALDPTAALDVEYAETCIRAAIAAAQDERPEMELLLNHARDLAERIAARDRRAVWPRAFNIIAGELWFEVDRFGDALAAYERAVRADGSPLAITGVARSLMRSGRLEEACAIYRGVGDAAPALRAAAAGDLARCQ
jgi:tetratricopeptide (TPR) repeat protein